MSELHVTALIITFKLPFFINLKGIIKPVNFRVEFFWAIKYIKITGNYINYYLQTDAPDHP